MTGVDIPSGLWTEGTSYTGLGQSTIGYEVSAGGSRVDLNTVYFEGNPLQTNNAVTYRNKIRLRLPQLQQIDASKLYIANALSE